MTDTLFDILDQTPVQVAVKEPRIKIVEPSEVEKHCFRLAQLIFEQIRQDLINAGLSPVLLDSRLTPTDPLATRLWSESKKLAFLLKSLTESYASALDQLEKRRDDPSLGGTKLRNRPEFYELWQTIEQTDQLHPKTRAITELLQEHPDRSVVAITYTKATAKSLIKLLPSFTYSKVVNHHFNIGIVTDYVERALKNQCFDQACILVMRSGWDAGYHLI